MFRNCFPLDCLALFPLSAATVPHSKGQGSVRSDELTDTRKGEKERARGEHVSKHTRTSRLCVHVCSRVFLQISRDLSLSLSLLRTISIEWNRSERQVLFQSRVSFRFTKRAGLPGLPLLALSHPEARERKRRRCVGPSTGGLLCLCTRVYVSLCQLNREDPLCLLKKRGEKERERKQTYPQGPPCHAFSFASCRRASRSKARDSEIRWHLQQHLTQRSLSRSH